MLTELLSLCVSHAGQAAWSGDVNSTKWTRLVIQATVSRGYHPGGLWASYSWHVWSLICLNMPFYHWTLAQLQISCIQCDVSILNIKSKNMVFFACLLLKFNALCEHAFVTDDFGICCYRIRGDQQHFVRRDELKVRTSCTWVGIFLTVNHN